LRYAWYRELVGLQRRFGGSGEKKNIFFLPGIKIQFVQHVV